jgi:hypothetical protein
MKNHGIMGYNIVPCHPLELIRTSRLILPSPSPSFSLSSSFSSLQVPFYCNLLCFFLLFPSTHKFLSILKILPFFTSRFNFSSRSLDTPFTNMCSHLQKHRSYIWSWGEEGLNIDQFTACVQPCWLLGLDNPGIVNGSNPGTDGDLSLLQRPGRLWVLLASYLMFFF